MPLRLTSAVIRMPALLRTTLDPRIQWLRSLLPPHLSYVEAAGPAVLLGKHPTRMEMINDVGGEVLNFSMVLRNADLSSQLVELVSGGLDQPAGRQKADQIPAAVERALGFFELCCRSMRWPTNLSAHAGVPDRLTIFAPILLRLRGVQVERLPVLDILQRYDSPFTCFLVDTAGPLCQQMLAWEDGGLPAMLKLVRQVKGRVLVCGDADPLYDEVLIGWRKVPGPVPIGMVTDHASVPGGPHFAWLNYPASRDVG
jgi:hypothetical protein